MYRLIGVISFLASSVVLAQAADIPLTNWTVPPYTRSSPGDVTTMTDATPPRAFIGVEPCRLVDTRVGSGFPAGFGSPGLAPGVPRDFDLDNGPCPGLPAGIDAYSLNITVTNTAGPGHLVIYPRGGAQPTVSSINYVAGETIANAVIVPAGTGGGVTVVAGVSGTNLLIDINGYFSETPGNPQNFLQLINNSGLYTFFGWNQAPDCPGACGMYMRTDSTVGNVAIFGAAVGATGRNFGVEGVSVSSTAGSAGVHGVSTAGSGKRYGVIGEIDLSQSADQDSAGVLGRDRLAPMALTFQTHAAGVRGESIFNFGVLGVSNDYVGVGGIITDLLGNYEREGRLASGDYGVYAFGDIGATGMKPFVDPHPTDASKVIRYVALEGNEPGTYFRGRGRFRNGLATINVPEDFRMVTDEEGLTVQVTPIGGMASVGVLRIGLDRIVVQSSRDLDFSYTVNGIRRTHKGVMNPIADNEFEYVPRSPHERMPAYLTEGQKKLLVQNGTYKPDGTVNMDTAQRLGWDRVWAERERPSPHPTPE